MWEKLTDPRFISQQVSPYMTHAPRPSPVAGGGGGKKKMMMGGHGGAAPPSPGAAGGGAPFYAPQQPQSPYDQYYGHGHDDYRQ